MSGRVLLPIVSAATATTAGRELRRGPVIYPGHIASTWAQDSDRLHRPEDVPLSDEAGMLDTYRRVLVGKRNLLNGYRFVNVMYST